MSLDTILYQNRLAYWLIALGVGVGTWLMLLALRRFVVVRLTAFATRTATVWDDMVVDLLGRTKPFFLLTLSATRSRAGRHPLRRIHERFEAEEIEFAYPTQTLFLARA